MSDKRTTLINEFDERVRASYAAFKSGEITQEQLQNRRAEIDEWYGREVARLATEARPAALFRRCGMALFGLDSGWKAQLGVAIHMKVEAIDGMASGERRIPAGVWMELRALLQSRYVVVPQLLKAIDILEPPRQDEGTQPMGTGTSCRR